MEKVDARNTADSVKTASSKIPVIVSVSSAPVEEAAVVEPAGDEDSLSRMDDEISLAPTVVAEGDQKEGEEESSDEEKGDEQKGDEEKGDEQGQAESSRVDEAMVLPRHDDADAATEDFQVTVPRTPLDGASPLDSGMSPLNEPVGQVDMASFNDSLSLTAGGQLEGGSSILSDANVQGDSVASAGSAPQGSRRRVRTSIYSRQRRTPEVVDTTTTLQLNYIDSQRNTTGIAFRRMTSPPPC